MTKLVDFKTRKTEQLPAEEPVTSPPNQAVLDMLDKVRKDVESGYVQGLVIIGQTSNGEVYDGWEYDIEQLNPYTMIGGLDELKQDFSFTFIDSRRRRVLFDD